MEGLERTYWTHGYLLADVVVVGGSSEDVLSHLEAQTALPCVLLLWGPRVSVRIIVPTSLVLEERYVRLNKLLLGHFVIYEGLSLSWPFTL